MPVDPAAQQILDLIEQMGFTLGGDVSPQALREQMGAMEAMAPEMPEVASSEWQTIEGIPCQIIKPLGASDGAPPPLRYTCKPVVKDGDGCIAIDYLFRDPCRRGVLSRGVCDRNVCRNEGPAFCTPPPVTP
jgi:hypothetical protein